MNKNTDIYSIEYYLPKASKPAKTASFSKKTIKKAPLKILVRDDLKDSIYLVDA
ncbi:MAG: hypothetical protein HOM63_08600 [Kordiimonadaceae bacterium]|jgi:hypothetical protein|nr:hypothetical protein [Kordiimonadaceae bacterium]